MLMASGSLLSQKNRLRKPETGKLYSNQTKRFVRAKVL
jgi:hypothetical protein